MKFELNKYKNKIVKLCKKYSVEELCLVGSAARNDYTGESDIDFMVTFLAGSTMFRNCIPFNNELESLLNKKVDLIFKDGCKNPIIHKSIMEDRIKIY